MDSSFDVADPSDWLQTSVSQLGPVETALRCQVCKDFFDTPMITSCSHTFCSLCIRRCLTNDGRCPTCRAQDQEMKLRPNTIVQELVDNFQVARPIIMQVGREMNAFRRSQDQSVRKRKVVDTEFEDSEESECPKIQRRTRQQVDRFAPSHKAIADQVDEEVKDIDFESDGGLTACPICNAKMKEEAVFPHLDVHNEKRTFSKAQIGSRRGSPPTDNLALQSNRPRDSMERLPQLNYSLLKDNALRKKLSELGIPIGGPRSLLVRRHAEWINLVNANCDSLRPRTKRDLLHELDIWDRTQGRQIVGSSNGMSKGSAIMSKDFDGQAWASSHENDFQSLIAKAREKTKAKYLDARTISDISVPTPEANEKLKPLRDLTSSTENNNVNHEQNDDAECFDNGKALVALPSHSEPHLVKRSSAILDLEPE